MEQLHTSADITPPLLLSQINSSLNPNAKEFIPGIQKHIM